MKKIIFYFILLFISFGFNSVLAEDYGLVCYYQTSNGELNYFLSTDYLEDENGATNEFKYSGEFDTVSVFNHCTATSKECLASIGVLNASTGKLSCPPLYESNGSIYISLEDSNVLASKGFKKLSATANICSYPNSCNFYKQETLEQIQNKDSFSCTYVNSKNSNKSITISKTVDSNYPDGKYDIRYPDGSSNTLVGAEANGNLLPSSSCDDIYYVESNKTIKAALKGNDTVSNNVTLSGLCESYSDSEIEHYCYGSCNYADMTCESGFSYNTVTCGSSVTIPAGLPVLISNIINILKIATPIILIIMGMLDFAKATMYGDDKKISESKNKFVKRIISAVLVFLVVTIVQFGFSVLSNASASSDGNTQGLISRVNSCLNCFVNNHCGSGGNVSN